MRLSIFLNNDLESNVALNHLLPEIKKHQFNLLFSQKVGPTNQTLAPLQYLDFLEREFILNSLFPKLDRQPSNGLLSFNQIGKKYGASIKQLSEITSKQALSGIKSFEPDLFISIRFGKIFKGEILSFPPFGIINLHSAILPDYKGVLGTLRAFIDGKDKIGSTIHFISDSSIDAGNIIQCNEMEITTGKSVLWHTINLYPNAAEKLCQIIARLSLQERIESTHQQSGGNYYSFPDEEDFVRLKKRGTRLYCFTEYAELLSDLYKIDKGWIIDEVRKSGLPWEY